MKMELSAILSSDSGIGPLIEVAGLDERVLWAPGTSAGMSTCARTRRRLALWWPCCASHLILFISYLLLSMYALDLVHV